MNYKFSNYNHFIEYNDKVICYNAISGAMLTISLEQYIMYNDLKNDLKLLRNCMEEIFGVFVKYRFIISNEIDEISILKFRNRKEIFLNNVYKLTINPTTDCNFKCWYCYEKHTKCKMSNKVITNIIKHIDFLSLNHRISGLNLSWFGGEPLLYFEEIVYPLSVELKKIMMKNNMLTFTNSITTNGYLINENVIEKLDEINLWHFQITLDGNENNHNKNRNVNGKPTFMKIIENINVLCQLLESGK